MDRVFELDPLVRRPLIKLDDIFVGCTAMLDTGALIPVWTKRVDVLQGLGAEQVAKDVSFNGFGGEASGDLYKLDLTVGGLVYPGLPIIASRDDDIPGYFIFSATMFSDMDYVVKNSTKKLVISPNTNQTCYNLKVDTKDGWIVLCQTDG